MKKILFAAVLAGVALVSCTKNEQKVSDPNKIVFDAPVLAPMTKAELTGTIFPTTRDFSVFAYYSTAAFTGGNGSLYMDDVTVTHNPGINDTTTGEGGAWAPTQNYYWPKNGMLSFYAYSPSTVTAACNQAKGIQIASYDVKGKEVDVLYSDLVKDKTTSIENTNDTYDGVQIPFKHALSVVKVAMKAENATVADFIKVTSISLTNLHEDGAFNQNNGGAATWTVGTRTGDLSYLAAETAITATEAAVSSHIVMPQILADNAMFVDNYKIKHGNLWLDQTKSIALNDMFLQGSTTEKVASWEMGKRYIYHLTFDLEQIYFAPTVTDWVDVNVTVPTIGN